MTKIKDFIRRCIIFIFKLFPIKKNRIYFVSNFGNRITCNPRAFFEYLYQNHKNEFEFYYCFNTDAKNKLPSDVKHAKYLSLKDMFYLCTSKYIVNNFRFHKFFSKRKSQIYIQTWHGGPISYKMIEKDAPNLNKSYVTNALNDSKHIDMLVVGSTQSQKVMDNCFYCDHKTIMSGNPRCDILINQNNEVKQQIKNKLNLADDDFVILYAPTFKDKEPIENSFINNKLIIDEFKTQTNQNVKLLYKFHPNLEKEASALQFEDGVVNVTSYPDIQDLILVSDILITDFSSCMFDMMLTGKLCIVYSKDMKKYLNEERGVYFPTSQLPFPKAENENELIHIIKNLDNIQKDYKLSTKQFLSDFGSIEDGKACERLYNFMKGETNE